MTLTYAMTAGVLLICLALMLWDAGRKLKQSEYRIISMVLIGTAIFYVATDCLWIIEYTSQTFNRGLFVVLNCLFYLVYITLPYIWFLFAKHFSKSSLNNSRWNFVFALPWLFNLVLVILTMAGTGLLWQPYPNVLFQAFSSSLHIALINSNIQLVDVCASFRITALSSEESVPFSLAMISCVTPSLPSVFRAWMTITVILCFPAISRFLTLLNSSSVCPI